MTTETLNYPALNNGAIGVAGGSEISANVIANPSTATDFQLTQAAAKGDDPFAPHRWHVEAGLHGALETWNYNVSHEELYGLTESLTYGLKEGIVLTMNQHVYYVSQRANDSWLLGLTCGVRGRIFRRGRAHIYIEGSVGLSDAAIAAPPRGTRFNYLAMGAGGVLLRLFPRVCVFRPIVNGHSDPT